MGLGAATGAALLAVTLPGQSGSAPPEPPWTALAADIRVLDGDTLRLGGRLLRLHGVAVPQRGQATCPGVRNGTRDCAGAAAEALVRLVAGRAVECRIERRDAAGRALGTCRARDAGRAAAPDGEDLNAALVAAGWAMAEPGTRPALTSLEAAARRDGRGLWAADATPADAWRRRF